MSTGAYIRPHEVAKAVDLREKGFSWPEIARQIGRTDCHQIAKKANAVIDGKPKSGVFFRCNHIMADKSETTEDEIMYPPHLKNWNVSASRTSFIEGLAAGAWIPSEHKQYSNPKLPLP